MDDNDESMLLINSSPSSNASESDAYNTAFAKVHFGPLRSPEKQFVPIAIRPDTLHPGIHDSPLRRSPRHSSPRSLSPSPHSPRGEMVVNGNELNDAMEEVEKDQSRPETPDLEQFLTDEPSSVLASKIIRAHDNPSPPPTSSSSQRFPKSACDGHFVDILDTPTPTELVVIVANAETQLESTPVPTIFPLADISQTLSPRAADDPQWDLIAFDSFSTPYQTDVLSSPGASTSRLPPASDKPSVDDLLANSPNPRLQNSRTPSPLPNQLSVPALTIVPPEDSGLGEIVVLELMGPDSADEQAVADAILFVDDKDTSKGSNSPRSVGSPISPHPDTGDSSATSAHSPPHTPVRRSNRPRRSPAFLKQVPDEPEEELKAAPSSSLLAPSSARTQRRIHKGKQSTVSPSGEVSDSQSEGMSRDASGPDEEEGKIGGRRRRGEREVQIGHDRHLGSLSPESSSLLTQLFPLTSTFSTVPSLNIKESSDEPSNQAHTTEVTIDAQPTTTLARTPGPPETLKPLVPSTPIRSTTPLRFSSPVRPSQPSPNKFRLQPVAPDDATRTPARRIPIQQAVATGQISPQKGAQLMAAHGSSSSGVSSQRLPIITMRPTDSPAKRVLASEVSTPSGQGKRAVMPSRTPVRGMPGVPRPLVSAKAPSRERSTSVEPQQPATMFSRPGLSSFPSTTPSIRAAKLPFPLVPSGKDLPKSIPEEHEVAEQETSLRGDVSTTRPTAATSSLAYSSLRQPTSRIPRIGTKPYARPVVSGPPKSAVPKATRGLSMMRAIDLTKPGDAIKASVRKPNGSAGIETSFSDDDQAKPPSRAGTSSIANGKSVDSGSVSNLKRKRGPEKTSPLNNNLRPVVLLRKVPTASTSRVIKPVVNQTNGSQPKISQGIQRIRRVVDREPEAVASQSAFPENGVFASTPVNGDRVEVVDITQDASESTLEAIISPPQLAAQEGQSRIDTSSTSTSDPGEILDVRRTTRIRKQSSAMDVFSQVERPSQQRRKASTRPLTRLDERTFCGMSAVALKALTSSNTNKNQHYHAAKIETQVVRKEGQRPDSPIMKVRTIVQREQEQKGKQRQERAERRARRSDDGSMSDVEGLNGVASSEADFESDWNPDSSPTMRHKRGPGDDEDYETPDRSERHTKRPKLGEGCSTEEKEPERQVRWDRGLYTTVYLDELQPGTRPHPKENIVMKGCLAPTAKALRLDTLGNHPNADSPLMDLIPENITVKKFVYEDEMEPVPVIVVKNTRSRSKKGKS